MAKTIAGIVFGIFALSLCFTVALTVMGKATPWQLIGAPQVVNSENLVRASGEPDYPWSIYSNDLTIGLLPCSGFDSPAPRPGDTGVFCSEPNVELENTGAETILRLNGVRYIYNCEPGPRISETVDPLLVCEVDPLRSMFS